MQDEGVVEPAVRAVHRSEHVERASGRISVIELGVALVGRDHEIVPVGKLEQLTPLVLKHHPARWVVGRADVQQLRSRPHRLGDIRPSRREIVFDETVDVIRRRAGQERRTLVDLIERIGNDHRRADTTRVDDRLRKRKQRLAAAEYRQHLRCRIERDQSMTARKPCGNRLAQRGRARRCGIIREPLRARRERVEQQPGCRMARLADRQADRRLLRIRHHARKKRSQPFERIRLQLREVGIQKKWRAKSAMTN